MGDICIRNAKNAVVGLIDLCQYIGLTKNMRMVEIGSYVGDSTKVFAERFEKVFAIDPWRNGYDDSDAASYQFDMAKVELQFDTLCSEYKNIEKMKCRSDQGYYLLNVNYPGKVFDFVYIDGLHSYEGVKHDIHIWKWKIKEGGFIGGHDYSMKKFPGVVQAVNEYKMPDMTFSDTSWIIKL